jgi:hypothetical protein
VGKILHGPVSALKREGVAGGPVDLVTAAQALFDLDAPSEDRTASEVAELAPATEPEGTDG